MHITIKELNKLEDRKRTNILNCLTGIKSANLIGTKSITGKTNLAIFNSVIHLGAKPALVGFIMRPPANVRRDTYQNIIDTKQYTINHVPPTMTKDAHLTSAKYNISEFDACHFTEQYINDFYAPFVKESQISIALEFQEEIVINSNDTRLIIGKILNLSIPEKLVTELGYLDIEDSSTGSLGLNTYYRLTKIASFPYAKPS